MLAIAKSQNEAKLKGSASSLINKKIIPDTDKNKDYQFNHLENTSNINESEEKSRLLDENILPRSHFDSTYEDVNTAKDSNQLIEEIDQLNQELDMGEKLLKNKVDPVVVNATKISDSLAVLFEQTNQKSQELKQNESLGEASRFVYANAQRQGLKTSIDQSQSNVTGILL